jgi:CRP/FNR family cyclic AMP-dependent transcriptional regulator
MITPDQPFLMVPSSGVSIGKHPAGETIFGQGSDATSIYYVTAGRVKLTVMSELGKEAIIAMLGPRQFFGEASLLAHKTNSSTAKALVDTEVTVISNTAMIAQLHFDKGFSTFFTEYMLSRNARIEEDLVDQLFNSVEKRLARLLLRLAEYGNEKRSTVIPVTLTQSELADMIGATRSRVSHFMAKFKRLGYVSYNGTIEVHHSLLSSVLEEMPHVRDK